MCEMLQYGKDGNSREIGQSKTQTIEKLGCITRRPLHHKSQGDIC